MKSRLNHAMVLGKNCVLIILISSITLLNLQADGSHGGGFRPPMRPKPPSIPGTPGTPEQGGDGSPTAPGWGGTPGPTGAGANTPITPGPRGPGSGGIPVPAGGITKKARGSTSSDITWEYWWARNRYQFLEFPHLDEDAWKYPSSPVNFSGTIATTRLKAESIEFLRPMILHDSPRLRRAAMLGLARLGDYDSLPAIIERLQDNNQTVRDAALLSLGVLKKAEADHLLLHMVRGSKSASRTVSQASIPDYFRGFAEVSLALNKAKGLAPFLRSIAQNSRERPAVRAMALESLGLIGGDEEAKFLIDFLENRSVAKEVKAAAVSAMGRTEALVVLPTLRKCLTSGKLPVKQSAALALGTMGTRGDESLVEELFRTFRHSNDHALKGFSLISMGRIGGPLALKLLTKVVTKGKSSECPWACLGLGLALRQLPGDPLGEHLLHQAKSNGNRSTRSAAAIGLGLAGYQKAVDDLIRMVADGDDPWHRGYSAMALGMLGDTDAAAPLRASLLSDEAPQVKVQVAMSLAMLRDKDALKDMIDLLVYTKNDTTRIFMAMSLSYMADLDIVEKIHQIMSKERLDDSALEHCISTTTKILSGDPMPYLNRLAANSNFACEYPLVAYLLEFVI